MLTVEEVAAQLKVHPRTVQRWLLSGDLAGYRFGDRAGWRIEEADLRRFLQKKKSPPSGESGESEALSPEAADEREAA